MAWALVSPASRGIGFALTRHLLTHTKIPVIATARRDLEGVKKSLLGGLDVEGSRLNVLKLDVTDESSISAAAAEAKSLTSRLPHSHLRLAFALPGILHPEKSPSQIDYDLALATFKINTLGPMMLLKHFGEFLPRKATDLSDSSESGEKLPEFALWTTLAARVGSTTDNSLGGWYTYRASKAAIYSLTKTFDLHLRTRSAGKAMAMCYHPGTVRTGLSSEFWDNAVRRASAPDVKENNVDEKGQEKGKGLFEPEEAAEKLWEVVMGMRAEGRGKCFDWRGEEILP